MKTLVFKTDDPIPSIGDTSLYAKFYRKHDFINIFDSYLAWGPTHMEIHCHTTPKGRKLIVDSMYYLAFGSTKLTEKEKAPRDQVETLCNVFKLPIKPLKK